MTLRKTKIVATIGPASSGKAMLEKMIREGLEVARLNFSHGSYDDHREVIRNVRELNKELGSSVALLADLQGPKIRIGEIENGEFEARAGDELVLTTEECLGKPGKVFINYDQFPQDTCPGEVVLLDDGKMELKIKKSNRKNEVVAEILNDGFIRSNKGVNLPNTRISLPSITEKDSADLDFALEHEVDWIGLSFVRSARDIIELKHIISKAKRSCRIIAKIEKPEALKEIDNILLESDGIMVARGDLGVEIPLEQVPLLQKELIQKCRQAAKPVIVATQMMESMIDSPTPTRAEVNDVANAVMDGADAVMLSAETSVGKHPARVIETMRRIILEIEDFEGIYHHETAPTDAREERFVSDSICYNACRLAQRVDAAGIATMTHSGYSAVKLSSQRPKATIFVFTGNPKLITALSLVWGVKCFYYDKFVSTDHTIDDIRYLLSKEKLLKKGDFMINIASMPITEKGMANMLKLTQV